MSEDTTIVRLFHPLFNKALLALAPFLSRDETRPVLQAVHITPTVVSATDSYKMVRIHYAAGSPDAADFPKTPGMKPASPTEVMVDGRAFLGVLKRLPSGTRRVGRFSRSRAGTLPILSHAAMVEADSGYQVGFLTNDLDVAQATFVRKVEGKAPPYDGDLWPTTKPEGRIWLNAQYLAQVTDAFKKFGALSVQVEIHGTLTPIVMKAENNRGQLMEVLLMPVREEGKWL